MRRLIMAICLIFCIAQSGWTQVLSGGGTLKEAVGARQAGMGEMYTALSGDVNGYYYNAASIADLATPQISSMYAVNVFDTTNAQLSLGLPVAWFGPGALALSLVTMQGPAMELNYLDGTSQTVISQQDFLGIASYGLQLSPHTFAGLNIKLFQSTLVEAYTAFALAGDVGLLYQVADLPGLALGLAIQNIGGEIKFIDQGDPMPTLYRVGMAYRRTVQAHALLTLGVDLLFPNDGDPSQNFGLEYGWQDTYFLRAGYKAGYDLSSFTLGVGLRLYGFQLDYAFSSMAVSNQVHRFSLGFIFK